MAVTLSVITAWQRCQQQFDEAREGSELRDLGRNSSEIQEAPLIDPITYPSSHSFTLNYHIILYLVERKTPPNYHTSIVDLSYDMPSLPGFCANSLILMHESKD